MKKPLKDVSGTTLALTSLAIMGAAAVVSTPVWMYYRRKRKRIDSLAGTPPEHARIADSTEASADSPATPETQASETPEKPAPDESQG